jgi:hypothetical protein
MKCKQVESQLCGYLDGTLPPETMRGLQTHLQQCQECSRRLTQLSLTQEMVHHLGRHAAPPDLALRLRVAISHALAEKRQPHPLRRLLRSWQERVNAMMMPATAGLITAIAAVGLMAGMVVPDRMAAITEDEPTKLYTPPELASSPFSSLVSGDTNGTLVVEATVDASGRVQDYRILQAPDNAPAIMSEVKNMLIFSTFRPATSFGQPTSGTVVLTFSVVNVRG